MKMNLLALTVVLAASVVFAGCGGNACDDLLDEVTSCLEKKGLPTTNGGSTTCEGAAESLAKSCLGHINADTCACDLGG